MTVGNSINIKWRLIVKESISLILLVISGLMIRYQVIDLLFDIRPVPVVRWVCNAGIVLVCISILYIIATDFANPLYFRQWYNREASCIVTDNIDLSRDEVIVYPNQDNLWEYLSVFCIIVVPLSFLILFLITVYGPFPTLSVSVEWYWWLIGVVCYCYFVVKSVIANLHVSKTKSAPKVRSHYPLTYNVVRLNDSLQLLESVIEKMELEESALKNLDIPRPKRASKDCPAPYVEYVETVANLGKSHPEIVSLEQLMLSVTSFPSLDGWTDSLSDTLANIGRAGVVSSHGIEDTVKALTHFVSNPDSETLSHLFSNISMHLRESGDNQYFKYKLMHSANKLGTFGKEFAKDTAKGAWDTFSPDDFKDNLHVSADDIKDAFSDLLHHFTPDFDLPDDSIFDVDFDFTGHFPIISTAVEVFKNIDRYNAGDVDMGKSICNSLTKVAGTTSGATIGATIGSMIFPGVGTVLGGMVGGWLAKSGVSKLNAAEFERLKDEFNAEKESLDKLIESAQQTIHDKQVVVNEDITRQAEISNNNYREGIEESPLILFKLDVIKKAIAVVLCDYVWLCAEEYSLGSESCDSERYSAILNCLPSRYELSVNTTNAVFVTLGQLDNLISSGYKEPRYLSLNAFCAVIQNMILSYTLSLQSLHLLWMERTRCQYTNAVMAITNKIETEFQSLNDVVNEQECKITEQSDKCKRLAEAANREAKTL